MIWLVYEVFWPVVTLERLVNYHQNIRIFVAYSVDSQRMKVTNIVGLTFVYEYTYISKFCQVFQGYAYSRNVPVHPIHHQLEP